MQTVQHTYKNLHPIFDAIERFYVYSSELDHSQKLVLPTFDSSFLGLSDIFNVYVSLPMPTLIEKDYSALSLPKYDDKNVIVCFSGGKDSIAVSLKLKNEGYNVFLYHGQHINPSFSDEVKCAQESADILGLPLYIDDIRLKGHHDYMEHPMKNMLIANGALHYGIENGIGTRIVFGNYTTSLLEDSPFDRCAGDCMDMWDFYNTIIQRVIPDFKIEAYLKNMGDSLDLVAPNRELMDASLSCLCRHSLRPYRHDWVKTKFGIDLPKHRCGSCYKCCVEYIYMADRDLIEYSEDYYKYCLNQLYKVCRDENASVYSIFDLWNRYMFYSFTESKLYKKMISARLMKGSIKWEKIIESTTNVCS